MKKFIIKLILIVSIIFISLSYVKYKHYINNSKDINYVVHEYFTSGIFNNYKMYNINNLNLSFSNGNIALVNINGTKKKLSHQEVYYNVLLEKQFSGIWKIKKIYPLEVASDN